MIFAFLGPDELTLAREHELIEGGELIRELNREPAQSSEGTQKVAARPTVPPQAWHQASSHSAFELSRSKDRKLRTATRGFRDTEGGFCPGEMDLSILNTKRHLTASHD